MIKYIFFGTPEFAVIILERLINAGFVPLAVVTNPDRPRGRKQIMMPPPIKQFITNDVGRHYIDVLQPEILDGAFIEKLKSYQAELGALAAYGKILPAETIKIFPKGIVGVHPSLLPKYRGPTPIQSSILTGEKITGVSLFLLDEKVDHGLILASAKINIDNDDNYDSLSKKLAALSADLLIETLTKYLAGEIAPQPQDHSRATYTKKITAEDAFVDLQKDPSEIIWRKVRALNPEPGVWTMKDGRRMKILEANLENGKLILKKIQFEGEKSKEI